MSRNPAPARGFPGGGLKGLRAAVLAGLALSLCPGAAGAVESFSAERAMTHLRQLSEVIGPRKTGTPGEQRARDYVASELGRLGLAVRRLPVPRVSETVVGSENIVGVLPGRIADTILIASHHDTRGVAVPGANDDASGEAVMLETARVLAASPPVATVMFASFCAEEEGLLGSTAYARTQDLSRLRVMINLDPVGQREIFISPFPVAPPLWANRALARAAAADRIHGVMYDPLYLLVSRTIRIPHGADHQPFRDKGVPALSLSDRFRTWTYHTEEDRAEWIDTATLDAAGRAVLGMVRGFDENPSSAAAPPDDAGYVALNVGGRPFFIGTAAIWSLAGVLVVAGALWWRSFWWKAARRGGRLTLHDARRAAVRAGAPLACAILGALASEAFSQTLSGLRFSWWAHQRMHLAQAACFAVTGLALGWTLAARRRAPGERAIYVVTSAGLWSLLGAACLVAGRPDIAFYFLLPAAATIGAAALKPSLAGAGALAGSLPLLALVGPDNYADAVAFVDLSPPAWISGPALFLLGLPLALGLAASLGAPGTARARRLVAIAGGAAGLGLLFLNLTMPSYDARHRREVTVVETLDLDAREARRAAARLVSREYLRGVKTSLPALPLVDRRVTTANLPVEPPEPEEGGQTTTLTLEKPETADDGDVRDLRVVSSPPSTVDRARITLRSLEPFRILDDGVWLTKNEFTRRHVYADDAPSDAFRLSARPGQVVEVEVRLDFTNDILGLQLSADDTVFQWYGTITWRGSVTL